MVGRKVSEARRQVRRNRRVQDFEEKEKCLRWAGHVALMGESRNAYRVLFGRPERRRTLGRLRRRWEDNIKMDLRELNPGCHILDSIRTSYSQAAANTAALPSRNLQQGAASSGGFVVRCRGCRVLAYITPDSGDVQMSEHTSAVLPFSREALRNATEPVRSGFDLNEAAKKFGVLKATLASRNKYPVEGKVFFGPRPVLGEAICNIREMTHTCF
ncbi:hypothetical protein ANN_23625 [Periplaneta americana]|uniref:HTH psq-type domain-containing protein n=1 Tax=Periplaneta americana TaxID=6978 RepID=A0ABQ8SMV6_PERAM|nr:hypothetical protein ANN_23625 [Periplaneta americana]